MDRRVLRRLPAMSIAPATATPVQRLRTYASFVRLEHTLFSLPLILAGVFSARGPALAPARFDRDARGFRRDPVPQARHAALPRRCGAGTLARPARRLRRRACGS